MTVDELLAIAKALSDEGRLRTLLALSGKELCVCQVVELLLLAPSTVSKHLGVLKQAGLVELRKQGRWVYYRLAESSASETVRQALAWCFEATKGSSRLLEDQRRLMQILELDPEVLCQIQQTRS